MRRVHCRVACYALLIGAVGRGSDEALPSPQAWDFCYWVEGKGGGCKLNERPRKFAQFLQPELMAKESGSWSELSWFVGRNPKTVAKWEDLGELGGHKLRRIEYLIPTATTEPPEKFAGFVVIERSRGVFSRLFEWCGSPMPEPSVVLVGHSNVLVMARDFGGNIPMVMTWAWVWTAKGPMRIEVEKAVQDAITKVAPGHRGYDTGLDWSNLFTQTYSWGPSGWPGKVGVDEIVKAWFDLRENRLVAKRVEWKKGFDDVVSVRRWP